MREVVTILGPGQLGRSLASWAALRGFRVRLAGRDLAHAEGALAAIRVRWARELEKGRLQAEEVGSASSRLEPFDTWEEALEGADIVLEALPEDLPTKIEAWRRLARLASPEALLLTGSSSLPVGSLGLEAELQGRLLGFHLFLPVERMALVELVLPQDANPALAARAASFGEALHKRVLHVRDQPGYAASRMALAQGLEAMRLLEAGIASAEDLDALMVLGYGHPIGPLELSDRVGLDLRLAIADALFAATGEPRFQAPALLRGLVSQGHLGRKTGRGFLDWSESGAAR